MKKDIEKFVEQLVKSGKWIIEKRRNHGKLIHLESNRRVSFPITSSDVKSIHNLKSQVRNVEKGIIRGLQRPKEILGE